MLRQNAYSGWTGLRGLCAGTRVKASEPLSLFIPTTISLQSRYRPALPSTFCLAPVRGADSWCAQAGGPRGQPRLIGAVERGRGAMTACHRGFRGSRLSQSWVTSLGRTRVRSRFIKMFKCPGKYCHGKLPNASVIFSAHLVLCLTSQFFYFNTWNMNNTKWKQKTVSRWEWQMWRSVMFRTVLTWCCWLEGVGWNKKQTEENMPNMNIEDW